MFTAKLSDGDINSCGYTISHNCPIATESNRLKCSLKEHQKRMIYCMNELETNIIKTPKFEMNTRFGIIADKVGSGKSYCVLGHLCNNPIIDIQDKKLFYVSGSKSCQLIVKQRKDIVKTNIIIVPHGLFFQWESYITNNTDLKLYRIKNKASVTALTLDNGCLDIDKLESFEVILISSTMFGTFGYNSIWNNYQCQRLFIDEADSLTIPGSPYINDEGVHDPNFESYFTWYITASYRSLIQPYSYNKKLKVKIVTQYQILKNKDAHIDASFMIPEFKVNKVYCKGKASHILHGVVSSNVMKMICAGDIHGAITTLGYNVEKEEDIIDIVCTKTSKTIKNLEIKYKATQEMEISEEEKKEILEDLNKKITEEKNKLNLIKERLSESIDPISISEIKNPVIVLCCQNKFELDSIMAIMKYKHTIQPECPMCRTVITKDNLLVVGTPKGDTPPVETSTAISENNDKIQNLKYLLSNELKDKKVLIFSEYDNTFENISTTLGELNIKYTKLCGSSSTVENILKKFKDGDLNVLLLNAKHFGAGLNLEFTTDIVLFHQLGREFEKQVVGRCQRPGRTSPLNIWKLLHKNEQ